MKKLLQLTFLFASFFCKAQQKAVIIDWQKTIGGAQYDYLRTFMKTRDGGYILGGDSNSGISGEKNAPNRDAAGSSEDYWIVKLNSLGAIEWQKTIGGNSYDQLKSVLQCNDGGYILGGSSISGISGEKTQNSNGSLDYWIVKIDANGNIVWQNVIGGNKIEELNSIQQTRDGGYILGGDSESPLSGNKTDTCRGKSDYWVVKLNSVGAIQWQKTIGGSGGDALISIQQTIDGGYILGGYSNSNISGEKSQNSKGQNDYWIIKLDSLRNISWQKTIGGSDWDFFQSLQQTSDTGYIMSGYSISNISGDKTENSNGFQDFWIVKLNSSGNIMWQNTIGGNKDEIDSKIKETMDKGFLLTGSSNSNISGDKNENVYDTHDTTGYTTSDGWVVKLNSMGNIEWQKDLGGEDGEVVISSEQVDSNTYLIGAWSTSDISGNKSEHTRGDADYWILRLRVIDQPDSIKGSAFFAQNNNCTQEANETGIPNLIIQTTPKNFFGISDTAGKFNILTDTGKYIVKQIIPNYRLPLFRNIVCPVSGAYQNISFIEYGKDTTDINFANNAALCPYLQIELSQTRMRRCSDNNSTITYCNIGYIDTTNVQVIVTLPQYVTFVSASNPNYTINGKKITFNIGTLHANECGTIHIITHVDCVNGITGLTQCISAYILPRNKCVYQSQPDYNLWDKSDITVDGLCTGTTVRFVIKNSGNSMADSSSYRIYKDAVQAVGRRFKLNANDSLIINVAATGNTYRLEADQVAHYPSPSQPSATVENCGTGTPSRGFVNQLPQDMDGVDVEKICLPIRDSYDPNDKQVFPSGVGIDKRVKHKVPLQFLINFQNTGNDTAYKVLVVDTLDQNLDLSTLEFGASSHLYKIEFTGSGRPILKFTFDKINLVDSLHNEAKSHGFISFKITPYDSIPNGTIVKNSADIYFDFNLPVKTNITQVSINDNLPTGAVLSFITGVKQYNINYEAIYVYPNPFTQSTTFEFVYNTKASQLNIYDVKGELIIQENIENKTSYQLQRNNLQNGMYFYTIQNNEGDIIGRGKLVLQ